MSTTGVQHEIRAAASSDAGSISALLGTIYDENRWFVGDGPPVPDTLARRIRSQNERDVLFLVAVGAPPLDRHEHQGIVGWLELQRLAPAKLRHVAVLTIAVGHDHRRRGIGTRLLRQAYEWARRVGVQKISLNVRANNHAAIALYEREGFVHEGREERHVRLADGFEANVIMALFMGRTPSS